MAASVEDVSELAPAQQPRRGSQLSQRSGKISLPAKISDLYQTYPGDGEGMVQVGVLHCTVLYCTVRVLFPGQVPAPAITFTRASLTSTTAESCCSQHEDTADS